MERIVVIGTTGTGKSTLAEQLSRLLEIPVVELDALYWRPNWTPAPDDELRRQVAEVVAGERWVITGNYRKLRDLVWTRADTIIWLDYSLPLVMWRLFKRTLKRLITREELWGTGNRESWRNTFLSKNSLFLWALQTHPKHRREYPAYFEQPDMAHTQRLRFRTPQETARWLRELKSAEPVR